MDQKQKSDWGFRKLLDFSHPHTFNGRVKNILFVFAVDLIWTVFVSAFLMLLVGFSAQKMYSLLVSYPSLDALRGQNLFQYIIGVYGEVKTAPTLSAWGTIAFMFFRACILAPLWEEAVFRIAVINLTLALLAKSDVATRNRVLLSVCVAMSAIFGLLHGSTLNILIQGVGGLLFCWLYLKNKSIWSPIIAHFLWNFMIIFGLPVLFLSISAA